MRLVTYGIPTALGELRRVGISRPDGAVVDVTAAREIYLRRIGKDGGWSRAAVECPTRMVEFIARGDDALEAAAEAVDAVADVEPGGIEDRQPVFAASRVRLLPPLTRPNSIRCFSLSERHMLAGIASMQDTSEWGGTKPSLTSLPPEWYKLPTYYKTATTEVYGPGDEVPWPSLTERFDYELEVAVVIGREGRQVGPDTVDQYIYGYTLFNDWSARDFQNREMSVNLGPGLCKDNAVSLGPCIVTKDEIDLAETSFFVRVDGQEWARTQVDFHFPLTELVQYVTEVQTIFPGDIFTSGTLPGGSGAEIKRWIAEGSEVELAAEGIGVLTNRVGRRGERTTRPAAQHPWTHLDRRRDS